MEVDGTTLGVGLAILATLLGPKAGGAVRAAGRMLGNGHGAPPESDPNLELLRSIDRGIQGMRQDLKEHNGKTAEAIRDFGQSQARIETMLNERR